MNQENYSGRRLARKDRRRRGRRARQEGPTVVIGAVSGVLVIGFCVWFVLGRPSFGLPSPRRPSDVPGVGAGSGDYLDSMRISPAEYSPRGPPEGTAVPDVPKRKKQERSPATGGSDRSVVARGRKEDGDDGRAKRTEALFAHLDAIRAREASAREEEITNPRSAKENGDPQPAKELVSRVLTLEVSGNILGLPLDKNDSYTWGRLGYFFQQELDVPYVLVLPNGTMAPLFRYGGVRGKKGRFGPKPPPPPRRRSTPAGEIGRPRYMIRVNVAAGGSGGITFYNQRVGQNITCRISATIYDTSGDSPQLLRELSVSETVTQMTGSRIKTDQSNRFYAYHMALDKLMASLRATSILK